MLINFEKELNKLQDIRNGTVKEGLALGVKEIDEFFRFKFSSFDIFLGHANSGKTTLTLFLMLLYSVKHKLRWLVFSSENEPFTLIKRLIEMLSAEPINKISNKDFIDNKEFVYSHFKFIDCNHLFSYASLLELAKEIKKAWDYHGFLVDPYNSLMKDRNKLKGLSSHDYDYEATSELRVFCKKHNVSIWLCTHAATEALRKKHKDSDEYAGHPIPPMASDVEGGGKFVNRCDCFVVIHRYVQHPTNWMYSFVHIRKVKNTDSGGRPTPIDNPIKLKSIKNNVGFSLEGNEQSILKTLNIPF
tara:strand:- start:1179 stop:2084 length:906 start_codon:yes stop_codon:yes gene_type:complete